MAAIEVRVVIPLFNSLRKYESYVLFNTEVAVETKFPRPKENSHN